MAKVEGGPGPHPLPLRQSRRGAQMPPSGQHELSCWNPSRVRNQSRLLSLNCPGIALAFFPATHLAVLWHWRTLSGILEVGTCRAQIHSRDPPLPSAKCPLHFSLSACHRCDLDTPCRFTSTFPPQHPPDTDTQPPSPNVDDSRLPKQRRPRDARPNRASRRTIDLWGRAPRPSMTPEGALARH